MTETHFRPLRSVLYMPGANTRALEKARTLDADAIILDLEDAVAPDTKDDARRNVAAAMETGGYGDRVVAIRINGPDTAWFDADLAMAAEAQPDAVLVPKVSSGAEVDRLSARMDASGVPASTRLWIMIETPRAILELSDIARRSGTVDGRLAAFILGTNDLAKETGAGLGEDRLAMVPWLTQTVAAARAYGLAVIDGVYNDFRDIDGLTRECAQGRLLGMDGKTLIHPAQLSVANTAFAPADAEVALAREIIAAFAQPENQSAGVLTVNGRMVERLHAEIAHRTVAIADAIAARDTAA
ncbi:MAG: CoA ester lyase [Pseudomonadota bacterium]